MHGSPTIRSIRKVSTKCSAVGYDYAGAADTYTNTLSYHVAGTFGQPASSGSLAYYTRTQGADSSTALVESFTGENYRIALGDNVLEFNGTAATTTFGLFTSTVFSCLGLNAIASDQYLAIVIPGKMFKNAFEDKNLAPENLSRTLEDSGTVTSVLIPWNTCGAYQSGVLGVGVGEYFIYAIFNWLSPFTTLFFAAFNIKIKQLIKK